MSAAHLAADRWMQPQRDRGIPSVSCKLSTSRSTYEPQACTMLNQAKQVEASLLEAADTLHTWHGP